MLRNLLTLPRRRLVFKITGLSVLLVGLTIAYFAWQNYHRERWLMQARFGKALQRIVQVSALTLDGDDHAALAEGDPGARDRLRDFIDRVEMTSKIGDEALFTVHVDPVAVLGHDESAPITLQRGVPEGEPVTFAIEANRAIRRALIKGTSSYSSLYFVDGQEEISAFAALKDKDGHIVALLVGNHDLTEISEARAGIYSRVVITSTAAILLAMLASGLLALGIGRALQRIRAGATAIKEQNYDHRITMKRSDELGMVAEQFNEMAETLAQRVQLLKYLPAYTLDAIVQRSRQGHASEIEAKVGSVMFTDIRGYTSLSEGVGAEGVVAILNTYVRRQAELLEAHGGVIDKFIGDAVLGVFMGDDHARRAVECGLAIQDAVVEMNDNGLFDFPVNIGIGIACGNLVLAEIGSDERRERSLIGSVVNLAARLCSKASANEVVVSDAVCDALGSDLVIGSSEQAELKGFAGLQGCHVVGSLG